MDKRVLLSLIMILVLGTVIRLTNLGEREGWTDELYTLKTIQGDYKTVFHNLITVEGAPPLYHFIMKAWTSMFGATVLALRMFSVIFGVLCMLMIFLIARKLFSDWVGIFSSFFLSISMLNVLYSQDGRMYTFSLFLMMTSTYYFIRMLKEKKNSDVWLYSLFTILSIYANYIGAVIFAMQVIYAWMFMTPNDKRRFFMQGIAPVGVICAPLMLMFYLQFTRLFPLWQQKFVTYGFPRIFQTMGVLAVFIIFAAMLTVYVIILSSRKIQKMLLSAEFAVLLLFLYIVGFFLLINTITHSVFFTRYFLFLLPVFYMYTSYVSLKNQRYAPIMMGGLTIIENVGLILYWG